MCGIAGFYGEIADGSDARARLGAMTGALAHRGPDGEGHWLGPGVGLGHTRLAIIDLNGGAQPMWNCAGNEVIVFNGEIYNHEELRGELCGRGYRFQTRSDTEVIPAAIDAWGIDEGLRKLRGMFAFALYDCRARKLLLARDRVGIKPLYLARFAEGIAFASEPKALLSLPNVRRRINPRAIHDFLGAGYATTPDTCFHDIQSIEPGCWIEFAASHEKRGRYWTWTPRDGGELSINAAVERLDVTLRDAVTSHLVADVPVGAFLSGGLDSSLIVAMLKGRGGVKTFSVGFGDAAFDETRYARSVARQVGAEHNEIQLPAGGGDPDLVRQIVEQFDEPFGDSSCIPAYLICREVRKQMKVVLSGDGGDEALGGYARYRRARQIASLARLNGLLPRLEPFAAIAARCAGRGGHRIFKAWQFAQLPPAERLAALQSYFQEDERRTMYQPEFARLAAGEGSTAGRLNPLIPKDAADPVQQMTAAEMRLRLHADYLRKVDVTSSAHGLEVRVPYLDAAMLDFAAELPVRCKIAQNGETKILSRRLVRKYLPPEIGRRPKQGFSIPLDQWAGPRMRAFFKDLLLDPAAQCASLIRPRRIYGVWNAFVDPASAPALSRYQRYQRLFLFVSLELWLRRWSPSPP